MRTTLMKNILLLVAFVAVGTVCWHGGKLAYLLEDQESLKTKSERQREVQRIVDRYEPSCEELKAKIPILVKRDNMHFFVASQEKYFYVFGVSTSPGESPAFAWWGGALPNALKQACGSPGP